MTDNLFDAVVTTDQDDYAPGSVATIGASGFGIGDALAFEITVIDPVTHAVLWSGPSWQVADTADGVADGAVATSVFVTSAYANTTIQVTVTDVVTGEVATHVFTDGPPHEGPAILAVGMGATDSSANLVTVNNAIFTAIDTGATGTGVIQSFLVVQQQGSADTSQGYNTDFRYDSPFSAPLDDKTERNFVHSLQLKDIPLVYADGTPVTDHNPNGLQTYYQFNLDINENQNQPLISLDALQIWQANTGNRGDYDPGATPEKGTGAFTGPGATLVYNLDANGDTFVSIDTGPGSGHGDIAVLIPSSNFTSTPDSYVYLYSAFGYQQGEDVSSGGFEEWWVSPSPGQPLTPNLAIDKNIVCPDGDDVFAANDSTHPVKLLDTNGKVTYQIVVTNTGQVDITNPIVTDPTLQDPVLQHLVNPVQSGGTGSNSDNVLQVGETWTYTVDAVWAAYLHTNTAEVVANGGSIDHSDSATYFGLDPHITLTKLTNGSHNANFLLQGQAVTWTYDVTNTGNVGVTGITVVDDNGTPLKIGDDFNPTNVSGDTNNNHVLDIGETWHFTATDIVGSATYSNTATATGLVTDDCGDLATPSASDSSGYTVQAAVGLTKGYWGTHFTVWDVITGDEKGAGPEINISPKYDWNKSAGVTPNTTSAVNTTGAGSSLGLVNGANNGGGDSGLLMGDLNHDGLLTGDGAATCHLYFDLASAQALLNSSVVSDARIILAGQAIAAQLNEYQDFVNYGHDTSPNGLINEAVRWLKGDASFALSTNGKSNVDATPGNDITVSSVTVPTVINDGGAANDYTLSGGAITLKGTALSSSDASWNKYAQMFDEGGTSYTAIDTHTYKVTADGEGLKNALAAYNHGLGGSTGGFVISTDGTLIAWQDSLGSTPYDVHANTADAFWGILLDQNLLHTMDAAAHPLQIAGISHL